MAKSNLKSSLNEVSNVPLLISNGLGKGYFGVKFMGRSVTTADVKFVEFSDGYNDQLEIHWSGGLSGYNKTGLDEEQITDIIRYFGTESIFRIYGEIVSGGYFLTYNLFPMSEIGKREITARKPRRRGIDDSAPTEMSAQ